MNKLIHLIIDILLILALLILPYLFKDSEARIFGVGGVGSPLSGKLLLEAGGGLLLESGGYLIFNGE